MTAAHPAPTRGALARRVVVLGGLSSFGPLSLDLYLPGLPALTADLHAGEAAGQLSLSACMIGLALGQLVVGPLTDRIGRRVPLLIGVAVYAGSAGLCALAPSIDLLLVLRLLGGLAGGSGLVIARAMVRDLYAGAAAARMYAVLMLVSNIAPVLAPLAGGLLLGVTGWRGLFVVLAGIGVLLLLGAFTQEETLPPGRRRVGGFRVAVRVLGGALRDRSFVVPALAAGIGVCGMFVYIAMASFVLQGPYGLDARQFALIFGVNALAITLVGRLGLAVLDRVGPRRLLTAGLLVAVGAAAVMVIGVLASRSVWALLPPLLVLVACTGVILPNATALALENQGEAAGTASALLGLSQFLFAAVVPPLASVRGVTPVVMAATILATATVAAVLWCGARPRAPAVAAGG